MKHSFEDKMVLVLKGYYKNEVSYASKPIKLSDGSVWYFLYDLNNYFNEKEIKEIIEL